VRSEETNRTERVRVRKSVAKKEKECGEGWKDALPKEIKGGHKQRKNEKWKPPWA